MLTRMRRLSPSRMKYFQMQKSWEEATPNQKIDLISNLISQSRGIKGGDRIWGAAIGQLSNGDQAYTMAGVARMNNFRSDAGLDVATAIVAGKQALKISNSQCLKLQLCVINLMLM